MSQPRLVIAERFRSVREMLAAVCAPEFEIVGEAADGYEAVCLCRTHAPDLLLTEVSSPGLSGCDVSRQLGELGAGVRILFFCGTEDHAEILSVLRISPAGLVYKAESLGVLLAALRVIAAGGTYLSALRPAAARVPVGSCSPLTRRESEILRLIAASHTTKEIAGLLGISCRTVDNHRQHLMAKLRLHDVAALTRYVLNRWPCHYPRLA